MKGKVEDKMLRDLFRQKLENAEIMPSPETGIKLMRQVGRREFLRFNPSRFNIWYAGAIAVTGAALVIILASPAHKNNLSGVQNINTSAVKSENVPEASESIASYPEIKAQSPIKESGNIPKKTIKTNTAPVIEKPQTEEPGSSVVPVSEIVTISGKDVFKGGNSVTGNLRSQSPV
ncbi:MAG: hypothetical protein ABSA76_03065, partial [Bacteroidales bacterium]